MEDVSLTAGLPPDCVLFADNREPESITERLRVTYDAIVDEYEYGDYWIATNRLIGIERKTPSDFLSSLPDGRLDRQLAGLASDFDVPILLIHGELRATDEGYLIVGRRPTGWTYDSVLNKLQTYQELGVRLQFCQEGDEALVDRIISLARYFSKPHHQLSPRVQGLSILGRETDSATLVLAQIPSVGVDRARRLLRHFPSLQSVANASVADLRFVDGIGPKVARQIHDTFR